jgi:hypothetical protein
MEPFIRFVILAFLAILLFLVLERLVERAVHPQHFWAGAIMKTVIFLLICAGVYLSLPWFSDLFSS